MHPLLLISSARYPRQAGGAGPRTRVKVNPRIGVDFAGKSFSCRRSMKKH